MRTRGETLTTHKNVITVQGASDSFSAAVETLSLSHMAKFEGIIVITAKSYANEMIADSLAGKKVTGPVVILQNGIGVENAFLEKQFSRVCRCVLYMTAQKKSENEITFRAIASSPIGLIKGEPAAVDECVNALTTETFPFHVERAIQRDIWKKGIINAVFNSICPLLEVDNGIFVRDEPVTQLAREIVQECLVLAGAQGIDLAEAELLEQIQRISRGSEGVNISTLQDIQNGRETEIEFLNLAMARLASAARPHIPLPKTELLGKMILAKSKRL